MIILSDVHGDIETCERVAKEHPNETVLQLGDIGVGFNVPKFIGHPYRYDGKPVWQAVLNLPKNFWFFVGNHDNRSLASDLWNCLGNYGEFKDIFFVSGADSIDKDRRTLGVDYWPDEELNHQQASDCLELWEQSKATTIIAHDCPQRIAEGYMLIYDRSYTRNLLDAMVKARKPNLVIFGHHHRKLNISLDGTRYICLPVGETIKI